MKKIENSPNGELRFQFPGKLMTNIDTAAQLSNSNGKNYRIVTVEFANIHGVVTTAGAACYEGNYSKGPMTVGTEYLCTVTIAKNAEGKTTPYIQMSHLVAGGGYASLDDFGLEEGTATPQQQFAGAGQVNS